MPRGAWTAKDERKYRHILTSCTKREGEKARRLAPGCEICASKRRKTCQRIAAATVNRDRARRKKAR